MDGWVSLEVSPLLAYDTKARSIRPKAARAGEQAEPVHQDSRHPGRIAGDRGGDLRRRAGQRHPAVLHRSVHGRGRCLYEGARAPGRRRAVARRAFGRLAVHLPLGRAVADKVPAELRNTLGIAVGKHAYRAYREILASDRWQRLQNLGARAQRLLFASTGTKDKAASDTLYIAGLAAPNTVNTMPEDTLLAFAEHGKLAAIAAPRRRRRRVGARRAFTKAGIDLTALSTQLQSDGAKGFVKSWGELLGRSTPRAKVLA